MMHTDAFACHGIGAYVEESQTGIFEKVRINRKKNGV